jgi:hypothetical protein
MLQGTAARLGAVSAIVDGRLRKCSEGFSRCPTAAPVNEGALRNGGPLKPKGLIWNDELETD